MFDVSDALLTCDADVVGRHLLQVLFDHARFCVLLCLHVSFESTMSSTKLWSEL
jgi:hypothetical protein